jgi:hypothetical protein
MIAWLQLTGAISVEPRHLTRLPASAKTPTTVTWLFLYHHNDTTHTDGPSARPPDARDSSDISSGHEGQDARSKGVQTRHEKQRMRTHSSFSLP